MSAAQGTTVHDRLLRLHLRHRSSAAPTVGGCHQLLVPRHRSSMFSRRAFSVAGQAAWNSLLDYLRDPTHSVDSFHRDLKPLSFLVLLAYAAH